MNYERSIALQTARIYATKGASLAGVKAADTHALIAIAEALIAIADVLEAREDSEDESPAPRRDPWQGGPP